MSPCRVAEAALLALAPSGHILSGLVRNELDGIVDEKPSDAIPRELVVQYVVGAFMAVMTWWLDGGAKTATPAD